MNDFKWREISEFKPEVETATKLLARNSVGECALVIFVPEIEAYLHFYSRGRNDTGYENVKSQITHWAYVPK